jgi:hypothetical protein
MSKSVYRSPMIRRIDRDRHSSGSGWVVIGCAAIFAATGIFYFMAGIVEGLR